MMLGPEQIARRRLGMNARKAREQRGWTQEEAAESVGCSVQQLRRVERAVVNVSIDLVARLAFAYKTDVAKLFRPAGAWRMRAVGRPRRV